MTSATFDVPFSHAAGAAQAELCFYQQSAFGSLLIEVPALVGGVAPMLRSGTRRFTITVAQSLPAKHVWQPRTDRGRRLMALREHIVASGTKLLDLDEINQELSGGRRQNA